MSAFCHQQGKTVFTVHVRIAGPCQSDASTPSLRRVRELVLAPATLCARLSGQARPGQAMRCDASARAPLSSRPRGRQRLWLSCRPSQALSLVRTCFVPAAAWGVLPSRGGVCLKTVQSTVRERSICMCCSGSALGSGSDSGDGDGRGATMAGHLSGSLVWGWFIACACESSGSLV